MRGLPVALGGAALTLILLPPGHGAPGRRSTTCAADDPVPTPPGYAGWERSSVVAWEALEQQGGVVPEIEEDHSHAPPAWWRYPSPLRSAELLADEAKKPKGLYTAVPASDLKPGDVVVRARGAGACGKMAVVAGMLDEQWVTVEPEGEGQIKRSGNPIFFEGKALRPEAAAYRLAVRKDNTLGHVRELERDLGHLERTIGERPPLIARKGRSTVDEKVHDLLDEAWSLIADADYPEDRRVLTGRALALAAGLEWPGAIEAATAVLDDAIQKSPGRADALLARAGVSLMLGQPDQAAGFAKKASTLPGVAPRAHYLLGRALLAAGKKDDGLAAMRRYLDDDPADPRAVRLTATGGREPALAPPARPGGADLRFSATAERAALRSDSYELELSWPLTWRVVAQQAAPETGLVVEFSTGRVLREDGEAERAGASLLVQRPPPTEAAALVRQGARNIFPNAKLKSLPPFLVGSKREQFREKKQGSQRQGEVTTFQRNGAVIFFVLNASTATYPKLKEEYAAFVKSLAGAAPTPSKGETKPGAKPSPKAEKVSGQSI